MGLLLAPFLDSKWRVDDCGLDSLFMPAMLLCMCVRERVI